MMAAFSVHLFRPLSTVCLSTSADVGFALFSWISPLLLFIFLSLLFVWNFSCMKFQILAVLSDNNRWERGKQASIRFKERGVANLGERHLRRPQMAPTEEKFESDLRTTPLPPHMARTTPTNNVTFCVIHRCGSSKCLIFASSANAYTNSGSSPSSAE